jgi:ABC-type uncharacterized transport system involved in gliding motility auxiliary subunit
MDLNRRRIAPFGLYLALLAAIVTVGFYITQQQFSLAVKIGLGITVIGLASFAILDPQRVRVALTGRQARYGSNTLIMSLAFVGILLVINYLGFTNAKRWDLTANKTNTLSQETLDALKKLPQTVSAEAFFTSRTPSATAHTLLENYKANSGGKFDYKIIDPEQNPVAAQAAKITTDGTIVLQMGQLMQPADTADEAGITTALIHLISPGERTVYFLTGHGEHDPTASGNSSYSQAMTILKNKNYTVKTLNLLVDQKIPDDALTIIIGGPQKPLSTDEVKLLQDYVAAGHSLVVMEDPTLVTEFGDSPDPLAEYLKATWGITLGNDFIVDTTSNSANVAIASQYGSHLITQKLQGMVTVFPNSRSVSSTTLQGITPTTLVTTGQSSWAETDLAGLKNNQVPTPEPGKDIIGTVPIAVAAENTTQGSRMVVIGNSTFAIDNYFGDYGNGDFLINSIDWAAKQDTLINLTPKTQTNQVVVPPLKSSLSLIFLGSVIGLPGLVLISGILVWIQRRRRG